MVLHLDKLLGARLHLSEAEAEAWSRLSWADTLAEELNAQTHVLRLAVDLAFSTGQWERGWRYALSPAVERLARNEQVALRCKAALLAWERGDLPGARSLGQQALGLTAAVSVHWVRLYGYLGGVIAAAAGAGSLSTALEAYRGAVPLEAHATRRNRAAAASRVALDAGTPADQVRSFFERTIQAHPGDVSTHHNLAEVEILLRDAEGRPFDPELLKVAQQFPNPPYLRARFHLAAARSLHRTGRRLSALIELQHARYALRSWPGRVLQHVERAAAGVVVPFPVTPAQQRVLDLLVEGWGNRDIAAALQLSERTVAVHTAAMLRSAGVGSRTELVAQEVARRISRH
nr:LuxR C-terminal-related transcriptional regulator [Nesterenkonia alkaliphila]